MRDSIAPLFQKELDQIFSDAIKKGLPSVSVVSKELHDRVFSDRNRMPSCCRVMRNNMNLSIGDKMVSDPDKLQTTTLEIRYILPRK